MTKTQSQINTHFAHILFAILKDLGCHKIFMAPGSRSCPLSLAAHHYASKFYTHFDERALAFMALGSIKQDKQPACVITTSGTAAGNLLPALMEAHALKLPLILITADRPFDLHHKGANQTIKQNEIFKDFTSFSISLDVPTLAGFNEKALGSLLSYLVFKSQNGPCHINIPLHEPLFDPSVDFPHDVDFRKESSLETLFDITLQTGLIILGENAVLSREDAEFFHKLSVHLDAPLIADISSGYRDFGLPCFDHHPLILDHLTLDLDYLFHFGKKVTSKCFEHLIKKFQGAYFHFDDTDLLYDPFHKIQTTFRGPRAHWLTLFNLPQKEGDFVKQIANITEKVKCEILEVIQEHPCFEEAMYIDCLSQNLKDNMRLFIGNSLPIRHMDSFFFPKDKTCQIFTQRGVSGIDGLISTACGLATDGVMTFAFLGDLSSLYDINALSLISQNKLSCIPIVFNNHGGGIFSYLPIAQQTEHFDKLIATTHSLHFDQIAHGFDLGHVLISSIEEFEAFLKNPQPYTLVEILSSQKGNVEFIEACKKRIACLLSNTPKLPSLAYSSTDSWVPT